MYHVFGHTSPDTDAFASAYAFAYFLNSQGVQACAYRLGEPNLETKFVLEFLAKNFDEFNKNLSDLLPLLDPANPLTTLQKGDKICLTDHNEQSQSIANLTDFELCYVIDHHKISLSTPSPAYVRICPVGCTCTILWQMFNEKGIAISASLALFMLSAIVSDTLNLTSPTTTDDDRTALTALAKLAKLDDVDGFAKKMFIAKSDVSHLSAQEILLMDYKEYSFGGERWGIAGIETLDPTAIFARKDELAQTANLIKAQKGLSQLMIALVDIKEHTGYAIAYDTAQNDILSQVFGGLPQDGIFVLTGVVSRKKQIVPALEHYFLAKI